jgi:Holliday junction resolvase-like predicted endonuclease
MWQKNNILGLFYESISVNFLESLGHQIIKTRFKIKTGEVDIISLSQNKIIFFEVKYRKIFEDFEGIVDEKKIKKIFTVVEYFMKNSEFANYEPQIDLIFINKNHQIWHIPNIGI